MSTSEAVAPSVGKLQTMGIVAAVIGFVGLAAGGMLGGADVAWRGYLHGFIYWTGISIACLGILQLHFMVGGNWGYAIRRFLEAGAKAIPIMMLLFIPVIALGMHSLYEWSHTDVMEADPILRQKTWYLNMGFFLVRYVLYFVVFTGLAYVLNKRSDELDEKRSWEVVKSAKAISSVGTLVYVLLITFFYIDILMSLSPHWYSSIFGILMMVGQALATFAFCVVLLNNWRANEPFVGVLTRQHFWDLGNLCLAFTMLWTYMAFSQYLISWAGNLPEEAEWYHPRIHGGWGALSLIILVFHFAVPFLVLLNRNVKKNGPRLAIVAGFIMLMRAVDIFWIIEPTYHEHHPAHGLALIAYPAGWLAFGGVFLAVFAFFLGRKPVLPLFRSHVEPRLVTGHEAVHHG